MNATRSHRLPLAALLVALAAAPAASAAPATTVDEHRAVDPQGQIEVINVAGRIEVVGWDKPELAVTGTIGSGVEKLDITTAGTRTTVRVVTHGSHGITLGWNASVSGEAKLVLHVPTRSALTAQLVSSDLVVSGIAGDQEVRTVSGDVHASAQREVRIHTVSGDVRLGAGAESRLIDIGTVSGDVQLNGGGGELTITTVSGDGMIKVGAASRVHLKTVSGDFSVALGLAADGRFEAESISGDLRVDFAGTLPPAEYDLQTFSGDLDTCTGRKGEREGYGPSHRLNFREGAGTARVRVDTKSGDVHLCAASK
jgi:hypothetical protein